MERRDRKRAAGGERGSSGRPVLRYEPPAVAWEEEFEAVAASDCQVTGDCPGFIAPGERS